MSQMQRDFLKPPYMPPKNPFQTFLLVLSLVASAPLVQGDSGSATLDKQLNHLDVQLWGWCLLIGSATALAGMALSKRRIYGLVVERSGLILTGGAAAIYTIAILNNSSSASDVRYSAAIQAAYSLASIWRCFQINRSLRWAKTLAAKMVNDDNLHRPISGEGS